VRRQSCSLKTISNLLGILKRAVLHHTSSRPLQQLGLLQLLLSSVTSTRLQTILGRLVTPKEFKVSIADLLTGSLFLLSPFRNIERRKPGLLEAASRLAWTRLS
jgi:hypothetical protein